MACLRDARLGHLQLTPQAMAATAPCVRRFRQGLACVVRSLGARLRRRSVLHDSYLPTKPALSALDKRFKSDQRTEDSVAHSNALRCSHTAEVRGGRCNERRCGHRASRLCSRTHTLSLIGVVQQCGAYVSAGPLLGSLFGRGTPRLGGPLQPLLRRAFGNPQGSVMEIGAQPRFGASRSQAASDFDRTRC